jgi:uncharacterized protein YndB with AHSA1/START domain
VIELRWETDINASADRVFSVLADLRDYDRWLPRSTAFNGTTTISEGPIGVGTAYVEPSMLGTRNGTVTEYVRPTRLDFEQPMSLKPRALGVVGIRLSHTITAGPGSVHLVRVLQLSPRGLVKYAMPLVVPAFKAENERMMRTLKAYAESAAGNA